MPSSAEYRRLMDEALQWAKSAATDQERESFLQIARTWHQAALQVERTMGLVEASRDLIKQAKSE
jgi:hypothetical protein